MSRKVKQLLTTPWSFSLLGHFDIINRNFTFPKSSLSLYSPYRYSNPCKKFTQWKLSEKSEERDYQNNKDNSTLNQKVQKSYNGNELIKSKNQETHRS